LLPNYLYTFYHILSYCLLSFHIVYYHCFFYYHLLIIRSVSLIIRIHFITKRFYTHPFRSTFHLSHLLLSFIIVYYRLLTFYYIPLFIYTIIYLIICYISSYCFIVHQPILIFTSVTTYQKS
jgi:hypothetical protein